MLCNYCQVTKSWSRTRLDINWLCSICLSDIFPFNHYFDDDDFQMAISHFTSDTSTNLLNLNDLVFNPLLFDTFNPNLRLDLNQDDPDSLYTDCNYLLEDQFNLSLPPNHHDRFSLIHMNARSLNKNFDNVSNYLDTLIHTFSVVGITETWLTDSAPILPHLQNYTLHQKSRHHSRGGGVALFVSNKYTSTERTDLFIDNPSAESLFIELTDQSNSLIVGVIYRPPNSKLSDFNSAIDHLLPKLTNMNKPCFLLGDFNVNILNAHHHSHTNDFLSTIISNSFNPLINKPTRVTRRSATLIDNIFTTHNANDSTSGILVTDISDHFPIFHISSIYTKKAKPTIRYRRTINTENNQTFSSLLKQQN
jgi:hypothetical protein